MSLIELVFLLTLLWTTNPTTLGTPQGLSGWVDRIEGQVVVVVVDFEGEGSPTREIPIPLSWIPGVREGDRIQRGRIDREASAHQRQTIETLQRELFDRSHADIDLR